MYNIKDIVKGNDVTFSRLRNGNAFYIIRFMEDEEPVAYEFPVDLKDVGDATLNNKEKAIFLMRYIRKAIEDKTFIKIS